MKNIKKYAVSVNRQLNPPNFQSTSTISLSAPIGIFLGRIANFINSELYGRETDIFWSVKFIQVDNLSRHPSQIYEAIFEGAILFFILNYVVKRENKKDGYVSSLFLIYYSMFRFLIEYTREPDEHIGLLFFNLSMGQVISVIVLVIGIFLWQSKKNV